MDEARRKKLAQAIEQLTETQFAWVEAAVAQLSKPGDYQRNPKSDLVSDCVLRDFGDTLRLHHGSSKQALSKDRFEYAFERVLINCGIPAELSPRGNPGHDITIRDQRVSLKTQANSAIRDDQVWISKFMELGRGQWVDASDLRGLRQQFFDHMRGYDRILMLRALGPAGKRCRYELIEIPKTLLLEAAKGELEMMTDSRQAPKPGYCHVRDKNGNLKYQLYFDGGTERKLQIKALDRTLCLTHATWNFEI